MKNVPLYKTIADEIKLDIRNQKYLKGSLIPTEASLCKVFSVSRVTIRKAIDILVNDQYIEKRQGSGSRVIYSPPKNIIHRSEKIVPFFEEMKNNGIIPSAQVIKFEMANADNYIQSRMNLKSNEAVYYFERIMFGNDKPLCIEKGYMPVNYFPDLSVMVLAKSRLKYIEEKNYTIDYTHQLIRAISADQKLSTYLNTDFAAPLLEINHITFDNDGRVLDCISTIYNSENYQPQFIRSS